MNIQIIVANCIVLLPHDAEAASSEQKYQHCDPAISAIGLIPNRQHTPAIDPPDMCQARRCRE
jgi:hypothetical protein